MLRNICFSVPIRPRTCALNCEHCPIGGKHYCKKCGAIDQHRSDACPQSKAPIMTTVTRSVSHQSTISRQSVSHQTIHHQSSPRQTIPRQSIPPQSFSHIPVNLSIKPSVKNAAAYIFRKGKVSGKVEIVLGRRGVSGPMYDKIFGPGGGIEPGESVDDAVCRETQEEFGINIRPFLNTANSRVVSLSSICLYYIFVGDDIKVNGPDNAHQWEISKKPIIGGSPIGKTHLCWVVLDHATSMSEIEHGYNHWFTLNLRRGKTFYGMY